MDDQTASRPEIIQSNSGRYLYEEALAELNVSERDEAKDVIKRRLLEIQRMEACLKKAKRDLADILGKSVSEIAMLP